MKSGYPKLKRGGKGVKIDESEFLKLYQKGLSDHRIGRELGVHRQTVGNFRRRLGLPAHFKFRREPTVFTEEQKREIRRLHGEGIPILHIARGLNLSPQTLATFCRAEGLDTSMSRARSYRRKVRGERLVAYLREHGPTPQSTLSRELKIHQTHFSRLARELFEQVERFKFRVGRGGRYGGTEIYGGLVETGPVFAVRDDPRIVDYVAENVPLKVETPQDARTLTLHLKKPLGTDRARQVVERLGYKYTDIATKTPSTRAIKFTDEQLLELYDKGLNDVEIARILGVASPTVNVRRRRLGLPAIGRKKRFSVLDGLTQVEDMREPT